MDRVRSDARLISAARSVGGGRTRRLIVLAVAGLSAGTLAAPVAAGASTGGATAVPVVTAGSRYLALGDSVTFGYKEPGVVPAPHYRNASTFIGYPELLGRELHLTVANASCPGETSASLINTSAQSNGCENSYKAPKIGYRRLYPLHVRYRGSQLAYALHYLRAHNNVALVSLMIGANDGFVCIESTKDACTSAQELAGLERRITRNVQHILHAIRRKAHYTGQLVIVNYYAPAPSAERLALLLNRTVDTAARPFHVRIASGYEIFQAASRHSGGNACTAGLVTQLGSPGKCGIHPSYAGQALLAEAVEKVIRLG